MGDAELVPLSKTERAVTRNTTQDDDLYETNYMTGYHDQEQLVRSERFITLTDARRKYCLDGEGDLDGLWSTEWSLWKHTRNDPDRRFHVEATMFDEQDVEARALQRFGGRQGFLQRLLEKYNRSPKSKEEFLATKIPPVYREHFEIYLDGSA